MTDDLTRLAGEHGIDVPVLAPVTRTATDAAVPGFPSAGEDALAWWQRLHAVGEHTGHWPLLIDSDLAEFLDRPAADKLDALLWTPGAPARADELDGAEVLVRLGGGWPRPDVRAQQELLAGWPDEPHREEAFRVPFSPAGQPDPVLVALVPAVGGWQVPAVLGYGDRERFPPAAEHSAILRHWHHRYGAELVCMTATNAELAITRPPRTRTDALAFAWEYANYCQDSVDAVYRADDLAGLAASLIDAEVVVAWWD
jgi:hypothetical protein